jgi:predicted amidohydrolase YtcJ
MSLPAPELLLANANVITFDPARPRARAVAVAAGRITAVGDTLEAGPGTRVIDLGGATVVPGFNDVHAHMEREGLKQQRPSLAGARSVADVLEVVRQAASRLPAGAWVVTMPVGQPPNHFDGLASLAEGRLPTRQELDAAAPAHPVYIPGLFGNWGHPPGHGVLNSRGLALNGITRDSRPGCPGLEIVRDAAGEPTGEIIERNPRPAVEFDLLPAVPRFGFADRLAALRLSMRLYNRVGTTSIYEGHGVAPEIIGIYRQLWEEGALTVRAGLCVSPTWADVREARLAMRDWLAYARGRGLGDPWLHISGVHVAWGGDAAIAARARANLPDTGWSGFVEQAWSAQDFRELCFLAAENDLRLHTIVSDKLHEVVPILEDVDRRHPLRGRRWVIEHVARSRLSDLRALKRLGVWVTTIPAYFLWKGGQAYLQEPDGGDLVVPHRHLLELGVPLSIATDNIPYDPFFTLWVACARQERRSGQVIGAGQRLDAETALRLFTVEGASLTFDEDWKGPLKPGYAADLAVLSADPTTLPVEALPTVRCTLTVVGGRVVWDAAAAGAGTDAPPAPRGWKCC